MNDKEFQLQLALDDANAQKDMYLDRLEYIDNYLKQKIDNYSVMSTTQASIICSELKSIHKDLFHDVY